MAFKHKTDTVHYHETAAEARECHDSLFALCEHGMSADLCDGPQHYPFDRDEIAGGAPLFERDAADVMYSGLSDIELWKLGYPVKTHFQGSLRTGDGMYYKAGHDDPCVCSVYDKCGPQRLADRQWSGNWRDQFRAYND